MTTTRKQAEPQLTVTNGSTDRVKGSDPDVIEADIERTREELGETVEALAHKFDVKSRTREKVVAAKQRAAENKGTTGAAGGLAAVLVVLAGLVVWRRRRS